MEEKVLQSVVVSIATLAMLELLGIGGNEIFSAFNRLSAGSHGQLVSALVLGLIGFTVYRIINYTVRP